MNEKKYWAFPELRIVRLLTVAIILSGCAGVSYRAINTDTEDQKARGLRYYDSSPYLLVQTDNQGGLTSTLIYLPDLTKKRQALPYAILSSNTTTLQFQNGVLTNNSTNADETAIPVAVIKGLEQAGSEAVKLLANMDVGKQSGPPNPPSTPRMAPDVYLFKVVKVDGQWGLAGAEGGGVLY